MTPVAVVCGILSLMIAAKSWRSFERATRNVPELPAGAPVRLCADRSALLRLRQIGDLYFLGCIMALGGCLGFSLVMHEVFAPYRWLWYLFDMTALVGAVYSIAAAFSRGDIDAFVANH